MSEQTLCYFTAFMADQGLSPQTGRSYLSAVRSMQISLGLPDPRERSAMPILARVQAGIRRIRALQGSKPRVRLPITVAILQRMKSHLDSTGHRHRLALWAISASAFFGFFRLGELLPDTTTFNAAVHLAWGDVAVNSTSNPNMIQFHLKRSKCDQFGAGSDVVVGRTDAELCPVLAMLHYLASRGDRPGTFFITAEGQTITKQWFVAQLREVLAAVGLPQEQYAGHSFRIGAATTAALVGIEDSTIQALGRWHSAAFLQYIRMPKESRAAFSAALVRAADRSPDSSGTT